MKLKIGERAAVYAYERRFTGVVVETYADNYVDIKSDEFEDVVRVFRQQCRRLKKVRKYPELWVNISPEGKIASYDSKYNAEMSAASTAKHVAVRYVATKNQPKAQVGK